MWKQRFERALLITLGIFVTAAAALLGGVHPEVQVALAAGALAMLLTTVCWRLYKRGSFGCGAPFWILLGLAAVCGLQLLGLPEGVHRALQPRGAALAAYSTEGLGPLWHRCLSLDPPGTALECCKMLGYAALAGTAALLVRDRPRALLVMWTLAVSGMVIAVVAAAQLLLGGDTVFGVYRPEVSGRHIVIPFVNPNHAGAYYAALGYLHLGLALQVQEQRRRWLMIALTALPMLLVVASASRGAITAMVLGGFVLFLLLRRLGKLTNRQLAYGVAITVILGAVAFPASETIRREFGSETHLETVHEEVKVQMWSDAMKLAGDYPATGIGRGAFRSVFPSYYRVSPGLKVTYSHAENLLVQLLVELGPLVFGLVLLVVALAVFRFFRRVGLEQEHTIALLPIGVLVGQNLVDFNLEFPGTAFLFVVLLGVLAGLARGRTRRVVARSRRLAQAGGLVTFVAVGALGLATLGKAGVRYDLRTEGKRLQAAINRGDKPVGALKATREAIRRHPADFYLHHLAGVAALNVVGELPLRHFNRALYLNPRSGATQRQVGRALWRLGFPHQALVHYAAAIGRGVPVRGNMAGELYLLLGQVWDTGGPSQARTEASLCGGALALVGQVPAPTCLVAEQLSRVRRSRGFAVIARMDRVAATVFARRLVVDKRLAPALSAYQQILARDPDSAETLKALVRLTFRDGDLALALHWSEALVKVEPSASAYDRLGQIYLRAGRARLAEQVADRGLGIHPRAPALVALKAELLLKRGAHSLARSLIRELTVGRSLEMGAELRLLRLRLRIEKHDKNLLRVERIKTRIRQLQRLLKAGVRSSNIQR